MTIKNDHIVQLPEVDLLSVVVPARNEAATITRVIERLLPLPWVGEVVVVDNQSDDGTAEVAKAAGARVVVEPRAGMGHAVRAGLAAARHDWVMKVDADLDRFDTSRFAAMAEARAPGVGLVKGNWQDPADNMPMTRLLVKPALATLAPGLRGLNAPNSGIYVVNRTLIAHQEIVGSYAADLDVMLRIYRSGAGVAEVDIGQISHDTRDLGHYNAMAETIMTFFMERRVDCGAQETVLMSNDASEMIDTSLGLLAARARAGSLVHVYLEEHGSPQAGCLREALAPYPTAQVSAVSDVAAFRRSGPEGDLQIIAPYPSAEKTDVVRAAVALKARIQDIGEASAELLLMPPLSRLDVLHHFRPDFAFDVALGAEVKAAATWRMSDAKGDMPQGAADVGTREVFQSYASLPEALKLDLLPDIRRAEASSLA